jgi:hypothetical protein
MPKNKPRKVDASFVATSFHITRIECSSIWAIDMMAMGDLEL